jgi:hypothetical protein
MVIKLSATYFPKQHQTPVVFFLRQDVEIYVCVIWIMRERMANEIVKGWGGVVIERYYVYCDGKRVENCRLRRSARSTRLSFWYP